MQKDEAGVRVMCSNHASGWYLDLCRRYPDRLGWLFGPSNWKTPRPDVAFALDNDAWACFTSGRAYDFEAWARFVERVRGTGLKPLWAIVPDAVGNRTATLEQWRRLAPAIRDCGWAAALAVQDGMSRDDVLALSPRPDVIFVGGTTAWKWKTAHAWCRDFPRVHVGRVRARRLRYCQQIGAESCDGTGWARESVRGRPALQLEAWLQNPEPHPELGL